MVISPDLPYFIDDKIEVKASSSSLSRSIFVL